MREPPAVGDPARRWQRPTSERRADSSLHPMERPSPGMRPLRAHPATATCCGSNACHQAILVDIAELRRI